jgi:hypothetical protein
LIPSAAMAPLVCRRAAYRAGRDRVGTGEGRGKSPEVGAKALPSSVQPIIGQVRACKKFWRKFR